MCIYKFSPLVIIIPMRSFYSNLLAYENWYIPVDTFDHFLIEELEKKGGESFL